MSLTASHQDQRIAYLDDQTLSQRWQRAEAERAGLIRLARRRGLSPQDAEDCVHEAIVRVVTHPALDDKRLGALLTTVVTRSAVDFHRRAATTARMVERVAGITGCVVEGDPATIVCDRDEARWTARLVDRLPAAQRAALLARADGKPVNEIARDMASSPKAVESLISRARAATRSTMASGLAAVVGVLRRVDPTTGMAGATAVAVAMAVAVPMMHTLDRWSRGPQDRGADTGSVMVMAPADSTSAEGAEPPPPAAANHAAPPADRGRPSEIGRPEGRGAGSSGSGGGGLSEGVGHQQDTPAGDVDVDVDVKGKEREHDPVTNAKACAANGVSLGVDSFVLPFSATPHCNEEPGDPVSI